MEVLLLQLCCCCYCWAVCSDDPASRQPEQRQKKKVLSVEEPVRLEMNPVVRANRIQQAKMEQIFDPTP